MLGPGCLRNAEAGFHKCSSDLLEGNVNTQLCSFYRAGASTAFVLTVQLAGIQSQCCPRRCQGTLLHALDDLNITIERHCHLLANTKQTATRHARVSDLTDNKASHLAARILANP